MRDLYKHLGVSDSATEEEIRDAVASCGNASIRRDCKFVLLNQSRRMAYDQLRSQLLMVGRLRAELGLSHSPHWHSALNSDFGIGPTLNESRLQVLKRKIESAQQRAETVRSLKVLAVLGGLFLFGYLFSLIDSADYSSAPTQTNESEAPANTGDGRGDQSWKDSANWQRAEESSSSSEGGGSAISQTNPSAISRDSGFSAPVQSVPESGRVRRYTSKNPIAPLEIQTRGSANYFIKLKDARSRSLVLDAFVTGGRTLEVDVPLGTYVIQYSSGDQWYGEEHYFGPRGSYSEAQSVFKFEETATHVTGYTITLYRVEGGNLRTNSISADEF